MRINAHTHVFNLQAVFTAKTLEIILNRITERKLPPVMEQHVKELLTKAFKEAGDYTNTEELLKEFVDRLAKSKDVAKAVEKLGGGIRLELDLLKNTDVLALGVKKAVGVLFAARRNFENDAADQASIADILAFLALALKPSIGAVTDELMEDLGPDDVAVALSLDVTRGGDEDVEHFAAQLADTSEQVLRYPGRILPFVAVHGLRNGFLPIVERALNSQGFVGVKLYPSLGYSVDTPAMRELYAYCAQRGVPLLMHCNSVGFREKPGSEQFCDPNHWKPILRDFPNLVICFAHFGGGEHFTGADIPADSWADRILKLMDEFDNVYADISYHSDQMLGGAGEKNYFRHLKRLLAHPTYKSRILFGTDFWLVRMILREKNYWDYFVNKLGDDALFARIAETNPAAFLGLDGADGRGWALANYENFIVANQHRVIGTQAAAWLRKAVKKNAGLELASLDGVPDAWSSNNLAHYFTFRFIAANQMYDDDRETATCDASGGFYVSRLMYWNKSFESAALFREKCAALARRMDLFFIAQKSTYEPGFDQGGAVQKLTEKLADEKTRIADLGLLADSIYRCKNEQNPG